MKYLDFSVVPHPLEPTAEEIARRTGTKQYVIRHREGSAGVHSARFLRERAIESDAVLYTSKVGEDN